MLGSLNPLPFQVGGGQPPAERTYRTLRQAVGKGGSAENDRGIDGLWRRSEALGLTAAASSCRRALIQAFPGCATDFLPYYERILGLVVGPTDTDETRREAVLEGWTAEPVRSWNELAAALTAVDARLTISLSSDNVEIVSHYGRAFDAYVPGAPGTGPAFGIVGGCTQWPCFSTRQTVLVSFAMGYAGVPLPPEALVIERAQRVLRSALPSWQDFSITTETFRLDIVPLGLGALS